MREVTDPDLLKRLEAGEGEIPSSQYREVTDPALLKRLNAGEGISNSDERNRRFLEEKMLHPMVLSPASALQFGGALIGTHPTGRAALETIAAVPFGLEEGIGLIGNRLAARSAPKAVQKGADLLGMLLKNAGFGAGASVLDTSQEGTASDRALRGALWGGALGGAGKAIGSTIEALRPSRYFRGKLSPEELQRNLEVAGETNTGLGDVLESPNLKRILENRLAHMPGTGATEALQEGAKQTNTRGMNILSDLLGNNSPENVPEQLHNILNKSFSEHRNLKNSLYDEVNSIANSEKLPLNMENFSRSVDKYRDAIEHSNILKYEPDSKYLFNKLSNYEKGIKGTQESSMILDKSGKPILSESKNNVPTLEEANILKGKLKEYANRFGSSPDPDKRNLANTFNNLWKSLKTDIGYAVEKGSDTLKNAYKKAEENYAKNFSSFLDKDIYKFIGGNADPETIINKFLTTSPTQDLAGKLSKLAKNLPEQGKKLLGYGYLATRALDKEGELNSTKLATAIRKLGKNQFKTLFPDEVVRKNLTDFTKLADFNKYGQYIMHNPPTGQRGLATILPNIIGAAAGGHQGPMGAVLGALAPSIGGRAATNYLTSPDVRKKLIETMIKNQKLPGHSVGMGALQSILSSLLSNNQGQENGT